VFTLELHLLASPVQPSRLATWPLPLRCTCSNNILFSSQNLALPPTHSFFSTLVSLLFVWHAWTVTVFLMQTELYCQVSQLVLHVCKQYLLNQFCVKMCFQLLIAMLALVQRFKHRCNGFLYLSEAALHWGLFLLVHLCVTTLLYLEGRYLTSTYSESATPVSTKCPAGSPCTVRHVP